MRKTVMLTPVKHPPEPSCVSGLSSLSQVILETLTTSSRYPRHERRQQTIPQRKTVDPSGYYKEVYYRQFQAEPEAQPGCTQLMYSQLMSDKATQVKRNTIQAPASTKAAERTEPGRVQWPVCGGGVQEAESEQITPRADDSAAVEGWPSHLDNVSDFVIQQQDIRSLGDENLEDYNWRNFHGKESSSSKKYFSNKDDVEVDHTDERQETSVRSPIRILDQEAHNETQSKFSFKKIATRIIHTIPHIGEKNSNVHDLEATPQDDLMLAPQWPQKCHDPCDEVSNDMNMHNRNLNETAFGVPLFDLSLSPILGLSPIHKTSILSHLQPESHVNTNMTLDVVTTEDTLGDGVGGFINDIGLNSDVTIVNDNGAIQLAPVAQKSVFLCHTPPRAEITDDTQEETNCTKDLQNNTIEKSNLNSEVVLDIGCDVSHSTNELQPKELISDVSEKCSIPSVLASAGNKNTRVTGFEVDLVKDPDTSGTNKNARPQPKFASNTNSTNWQVKERETHEELFVVKLGATKVSELETSTSKPSLFVNDNSKHKQENIFPLQSRKSTFKVPFKRVSESPIVGYPVNKKHITSTPKDMYQSKLKGFGKSGERHSSRSSAGAFNIKGKEKGLHTHHQPCAGQETQPLSKLQHPWTEARDAGFDEASVSKKQFALKSKFLKKLKDFKIPTRNPQFSQSVNSHCLHNNNNNNNNNNEKIPDENREQTPVKCDQMVKTSQFPSRASKINFLRENPVERANNSFEAKTYIDNVLGNRTANKDNISNVGKSFKEKLSKFEHSPEMTNMDAEAIVKRKAMYDNCVSEEVAENEGNLISSPGKDNLEGLKVPQENSDHNVDMVVEEIHKGLKKKANVRVSSNKCWEKKTSKRKKAVEDKDKKVTKKMRKDNGEKLLSRENEDKTKQVNIMTKFNLKEKKIKQPKKDKMTSKATSKPTEKFQNKNKIGNKEEKATKSIEKTKIAVSADKVPVSLPLSQTSGPEHVLGRDTELFVILDFIAAASEICFTLLYRDCSSQLRERVVGNGKHPGSGQVSGFALRVAWTREAAPPAHLLPQKNLDVMTATTGHHTHSMPLPSSQSPFLLSDQKKSSNLPTSLVDREEESDKEVIAVYKLSVGLNINKNKLRSALCSIMASQVRKVNFDAQESITYLVEKFDIDQNEVVGSWVLLDPKVGGWLLNPDHPPVTFMQTTFNLKTSLPKASVGHQDDMLYSDLEALSNTMQVLYSQLCQTRLWTIFYHLEMRIMPILAVMELRGIKVDREVLKQTGHMLKLKIQEVEKRCHQVSGSIFNVNSHAQLRTVLFQDLKLDVRSHVTVPRTAGGQKSTCETALRRIVDCHPLPGLVLHHRLLNKLKTTYVDGIMACLKGSYIKAAWEQTSASTGRIQCRNPNLQSIPKHPVIVTVDDTETVVLARECFCSRDGYVLLAADFQQTELRMLAHMSQDSVLQAGFKQSKKCTVDIFKQLSAMWLDKDVSEVTTSERERTKRVVYSVVYGAGREKLGEVLDISPLDAKDIITSFMKRFPGIPAYMRSVVNLCKSQGFLTTIFNRRRFFPGIKSQDSVIQAQAERQAINFVIQGSAADISKAAMVQTEVAFASRPDLDAKLLIHIHDEMVWEVCSKDLDTVIDIVEPIMENTQQLCGPFVHLTVPLPVAICTGTNWAHMHPWTKE